LTTNAALALNNATPHFLRKIVHTETIGMPRAASPTDLQIITFGVACVDGGPWSLQAATPDREASDEKHIDNNIRYAGDRQNHVCRVAVA